MNPEKEVVNWWLNKQGYFTVNSIKVAKNKEINILAIKLANGKLEKIVHVETACSISSVDNLSPTEHLSKFNDPLVLNKIKNIINKYVNKGAKHEKALVLGITSKLDEFKKLQGIRIYLFKDILSDVLITLNKQNYRNEIIRTLQLVKYITLANPEKLAELIGDEEKNKTLKLNTREELLDYLLNQKEVIRVLSKKRFEKHLGEILKHSSLTRPEKLAHVLIDSIMSTRTRNRFIKALLEHKDIKPIVKKSKRQKPLHYFFRK